MSQRQHEDTHGSGPPQPLPSAPLLRNSATSPQPEPAPKEEVPKEEAPKEAAPQPELSTETNKELPNKLILECVSSGKKDGADIFNCEEKSEQFASSGTALPRAQKTSRSNGVIPARINPDPGVPLAVATYGGGKKRRTRKKRTTRKKRKSKKRKSRTKLKKRKSRTKSKTKLKKRKSKRAHKN
jgi:hypothetical protein